MNNEITKAIKKQEKGENRIGLWWRKNKIKILRIILFPIWIYSIIREKNHIKRYNQTLWSEDKAKEILNYYIPNRAEWDNKDKKFYFSYNSFVWHSSYTMKLIKRKDRRFWKKFATWNIRKYLIDKFELDGFTKTIGDCYDGWTEIIFTLKE